MSKNVAIYDASDGDAPRIGKAWAGAEAIGVQSLKQLKAELSRLRNAGVPVAEMRFFTHGEQGTIFFGDESLTASDILSSLTGNGFEDLFAPGARVEFDGCNVAEVKEGCEGEAPCAMTDNGPRFLATFARTLLFKGGGSTHGSTSAGWVVPHFGTEIHHSSGHWVHAFIKRGATDVRLAAGDEVPSPAGIWVVRTQNQQFVYRFEGHFVSWTSKDEPDPRPSQRGTWSLGSDQLTIRWPYDESERWDLPLYDLHQTGVALDSFGGEFAVSAFRP